MKSKGEIAFPSHGTTCFPAMRFVLWFSLSHLADDMSCLAFAEFDAMLELNGLSPAAVYDRYDYI